MKYRPKHIVEYIALRAIATAVSTRNYHAGLLQAAGLATLSFALARRPVREAHRRIREVFGPELPTPEVRRIAWMSWRNMCFNAVDMLRLGMRDLSWMDNIYESLDAFAVIKQCTDTGRGLIVAVPHMGSWELAGVRAHRYGIPILNIAAVQRNPLVNDFMNHLRASPGITTLARGASTMREVIQRLRGGAALAILPDVRMRTGGIPVPFLGKTANLGDGTALFARHTDVPILPCIVRRIGWSRHRVTPLAPIECDPSLSKRDDVQRIMNSLLAQVEAELRQTPEQWFWYNRRWVLDPIDPAAT